MIEYAAVVLLVAAIFSAVMNAGIGDRVAAGIEQALAGIYGEESGNKSGPTDLADNDASPDDATEQGAKITGTPEGSATREYARTRGTDAPTDENGEPLNLAPDSEVTPEGLGEINDDDPPVERFLDALADGAGNDASGAVDGFWSLLTDPVGTASDAVDAIVEDPVGLILSEEFRDAWKNGDWPAAFGYGLWDVGTTLVGGVGLILKASKALSKAPTGNGAKPPEGSDTDKDGGKQPDKEDSSDSEKNDGDKNTAGCSTGNSFLPGTPVLLADGTTSPIEDVAVGHAVWAFDPLTGEEGPRPVTATITGSGEKTLVDITIVDDEGDTGSVTATDGHPFWVPETAEWVNAIDLEPGTWLRTSGGTWAKVTAVENRIVTNQQVHNLTVQDLNTYYVRAGAAEALTHNEECFKFDEQTWNERDDTDGIEHSSDRHDETGDRYRPGKDSVWESEIDNKKKAELANATKDMEGTIQKNPKGDVVAYEVDAGKPIGKNHDGSHTSTYTVIRDRWTGDLVTIHPGPIERPS
ncbi:polymorphic toxin-type HINT domain-containing protein [Nocardiopsis rhodophaea]